MRRQRQQRERSSLGTARALCANRRAYHGAVTTNTKVILGVTCVEVHDVTTLAGDLTEDTLDWFAQDVAGNVWYFGENSKQVEHGLVIGVEGSWTAGVEGAKPGIVNAGGAQISDRQRPA